MKSKIEAEISQKTRKPALIVFGADQEDRPLASWFAAADAEAAIATAGIKGFHVLRLVTKRHRAIAQELAVGLTDSDQIAVVALTTRALFDRLNACDEAFTPPSAASSGPQADCRPVAQMSPQRCRAAQPSSLTINLSGAPQWKRPSQKSI